MQPTPAIEMIAGRGGLTVHVVGKEGAVRHHTPGRRPEERLLLPVEALAGCDGRGDLTREETQAPDRAV